MAAYAGYGSGDSNGHRIAVYAPRWIGQPGSSGADGRCRDQRACIGHPWAVRVTRWIRVALVEESRQLGRAPTMAGIGIGAEASSQTGITPASSSRPLSRCIPSRMRLFTVPSGRPVASEISECERPSK